MNTTTTGRKSDVCGDSYALGRKLMMREKYFESNWKDNSLVRKPSKKYISTTNKELSDIVATINKLEPSKREINNNISKEEEAALNEIKSLTKSTIEIKKADKTSTIVVMNKADYSKQLVTECHLESDSYEQAIDNIDREVDLALKKLCSKHRDCLTDAE